MKIWIRRLFAFYLLFFQWLAPVHASDQQDHSPPLPPEAPSPQESSLAAVRFDQQIGAQIPLELSFQNEGGQEFRLEQAFQGRPVILVFAYYECPMLCTLVLNDLTENLKPLAFEVGGEFDVVTVSIDPGETPEQAAAKKAAYLNEYDKPGAEQGWHFLTGDEEAIQQLAAAAGFRYFYDAELDQYAHPAGVILLTPEGKISSYLMGLDYSAQDLRLGLVEAAANKIGTPVDQFFLLCYEYDPVTGRYSLLIQNVLRVAGLATAMLLGGFVLVLLRREG